MTAHKNRGNHTANNWRNEAVFYLMMAMAVSLFVSRAALSITCILFVLFTVVHKNTFQQLKTFSKTPLLIFLSLLFFIPFVSGLWSENLDKWSDVVRLKLPLLFFPIAFAGAWAITKKQWQLLGWLFLGLIFCGCVYGLIDYAFHASEINESYLRAKTILTPLEDDHVRYSWLVTLGVILCTILFQQVSQAKAKILLAILSVFFVLYLHILSARTGVFSFYLFLLLMAAWFLWKGRNRKVSFLLLAGLLLLPLAAYLFLPTFKARLRYNLYDLSFVQKQEYLPGSSDGVRAMSLKAGWQVLQQNPLGAGAGDIMKEAEKWYAANVPQALATDKFYPCSEWLMYGGFAGWPGVLLFSMIMVVPFLIRPKHHQVYWISLAATAAFSFAFDMGLEVQYGIFLYAFLTLWWWKWFNEPEEKINQPLSDQ